MSSKNKYLPSYSSSHLPSVDASSLNHESPRERTKFYHALLELLYLKIDTKQFCQPIPDVYQRLRDAAALDQK
uniref:Uncharacterized protein n=1 Tax=Panagrolaimus sp. ES5 TaxID=591445 RepID=A0AC34FHY7_9BILA